MDELSGLAPDEVCALLSELRVHEIELELQNEQLRATQRDLEVSRARYVDLYDRAPVGYLTTDEAGLVFEANLTAADLLDLPLEALVSQPWTRFVVPDDQDVYLQHRRSLAAEGATQVCELRLAQRGGEPIWVRLESRLVSAADGRRWVRTVMIDVTERKRAGDMLKLSHERHRILFEESPDALMVLAPPSWRFTSANASTLAMFGVSSEAEFMAHTPWAYSPEYQPDGQTSADKAAAMTALAMHDGAHTFEWVHRRKSGEEFRALVLLTRMDVSGSPFLQAKVRNETEAEKQRALRAQTERLASMGLLAASVGHEINNPLAYVLSNVESLAHVLPEIADGVERCCSALRQAVGEAAFATILGGNGKLLEPASLAQASEQARHALDGAQRITRISDSLRMFSRVDALAASNIDLNGAIESAIAVAFHQSRPRVELTRALAASLPCVRASEGALSQVFLNLLVNASHALDGPGSSERSITVRTWADQSHVFAEVADTGVGISPENVRHIFEPFFSTKGVGEGSGLGLSICRSIIVELGGDIRVESALGKGSRFIVRLPAVPDRAPKLASEPSGCAPEPSPPAGRILIVDDEEMLRVMLKRLFREHDVVLAASVKQARALLAQDRDFDLILCDLTMPEAGGVELHRWLVEHVPELAKRVTFITGGAFATEATDYINTTGNAKITKPFDNKTLRRVAAEAILASRRERAAPVG